MEVDLQRIVEEVLRERPERLTRAELILLIVRKLGQQATGPNIRAVYARMRQDLSSAASDAGNILHSLYLQGKLERVRAKACYAYRVPGEAPRGP